MNTRVVHHEQVAHMASSKSTRYWFPAKRYGWGWGAPSTWQGWAVLLAYSCLIIAGIPLIQVSFGSLLYGVYALALTTVLIGVCWLKGERPRWRRAGRDGRAI